MQETLVRGCLWIISGALFLAGNIDLAHARKFPLCQNRSYIAQYYPQAGHLREKRQCCKNYPRIALPCLLKLEVLQQTD
jgi:hypothetical protein